MRLSPVKSVAKPAYPPQQVTVDHPELLSRLPLRWQRCRKAAVAAAITVSLGLPLSGCTPALPQGSATPYPYLDETQALDIISDAAKEYGLHLEVKQEGFEGTENTLYASFMRPLMEDQALIKLLDPPGDEYDAYDAAHKVGFDYWDLNESQRPLPFASGTPRIEGMGKAQPVVLVLRATTAEWVIRRQVTDFLDWLKSEGII